MKKNIILVVAALFSILSLTGCFESSDLIGKWQTEVMGIESTIEFKSGSMVSSDGGGQSVETKVDGYVTEKNRLGVVLKQGDDKKTTWFDVKDHDTISQGTGFVKLVFHRVK